MIARRRLRVDQRRADPRRAGRDPRRLEDLTDRRRRISGACSNGAGRWRGTARCAGSSATRNTPPSVRRLLRVARFGTRQPARARLCRRASRRSARPRSSSARRWPPGPTSSATTPRDNLLQLQDSLPPAPFAAIKAAIERALRGARSRACSPRSTRSRSAPPRSRRSTARSPPRAATSRSRCCAPASRRSSPARIETYEWAAAQVEALGGEARAAAPAAGRSPTSSRWTDARARPAARGRLGLRAARTRWSPSPASTSPRSTGAAPRGRVMTLEWLDGIKLSDRAGADRRRARPARSSPAILVRAFLRQAVIDGFFHADLHQGNLFALPDGTHRGDRLRHHGPDRPPRAACGWPKSSTA